MYKNLWSKLKPRDKEREIVHWIELFRSQIEDLINASDDDVRHHFNYMTEVVEWNYIKLYDNGDVFASADLGLIQTPGELLAFIMEAIDAHFFDYVDWEDEIEEAAETLKHKYRTIRELVDDMEPEELEHD